MLMKSSSASVAVWCLLFRSNGPVLGSTLDVLGCFVFSFFHGLNVCVPIPSLRSSREFILCIAFIVNMTIEL